MRPLELMLLMALGGAPSECLEPEVGIFDPMVLFDHHAEQRKGLEIDYQANALLMMVKLPSFSAASVVTLLREPPAEGQTEVKHTVTLKVRGQKQVSAPIDQETAKLLLETWRAALSRTRFPERSRLGTDGTHYHFWLMGRGAQIWSPDEGSTMAELVRIGDELTGYPLVDAKKRADRQQSMKATARQLIQRIKKAVCGP